MKASAAAIQPVSLHSVEWDDRRFAIESHRPMDEIRLSVERHGILSPPWVLETGGGKVVIVDGFKRLLVLRDRGVETVVCSVYPADFGLRDLWLQRLEGRLFGPPLNPAEKARVAALLSDGLLDDSTAGRLLEGFGLPRHPQGLARWKRLAEAEPGLLDAAAAGVVHERAALELAGWPVTVEERGGLIDLLRRLRCSSGIQVELVEAFRDISMTAKRSLGSLLESPEVRDILQQRDSNHREKTRALRLWLDGMRFPRLKARELRLKERLRRSPPPAGVDVFPPPAFEGGNWRLEVEFSSGGELRERLERLKVWAASGSLDSLLTPEAGPLPQSGRDGSHRT